MLYAEMEAVATGNPLIKEKMEVDNEVQRFKILMASYPEKEIHEMFFVERSRIL